MDDLSVTTADASAVCAPVASVLGVTSSLRFRPHGASQKAHVILRRVAFSENPDEAKGVIRFSLFAQKRIEVKPGKEILLTVADGQFKDQPIVFEGDLADLEVPVEENIAQETEDEEEEPPLLSPVMPPKLRRPWTKATKEVSNNEPPTTYSSIGIQADPVTVPASVQTHTPSSASVASEARPNLVSCSVQVDPISPLPRHFSLSTHTSSSPLPLPTPDIKGDIDGNVSIQRQDSIKREVDGEKDALITDNDYTPERSLSPMELDSPSSTPAASPVISPIVLAEISTVQIKASSPPSSIASSSGTQSKQMSPEAPNPLVPNGNTAFYNHPNDSAYVKLPTKLHDPQLSDSGYSKGLEKVSIVQNIKPKGAGLAKPVYNPFVPAKHGTGPLPSLEVLPELTKIDSKDALANDAPKQHQLGRQYSVMSSESLNDLKTLVEKSVTTQVAASESHNAVASSSKLSMDHNYPLFPANGPTDIPGLRSAELTSTQMRENYASTNGKAPIRIDEDTWTGQSYGRPLTPTSDQLSRTKTLPTGPKSDMQPRGKSDPPNVGSWSVPGIPLPFRQGTPSASTPRSSFSSKSGSSSLPTPTSITTIHRSNGLSTNVSPSLTLPHSQHLSSSSILPNTNEMHTSTSLSELSRPAPHENGIKLAPLRVSIPDIGASRSIALQHISNQIPTPSSSQGSSKSFITATDPHSQTRSSQVIDTGSYHDKRDIVPRFNNSFKYSPSPGAAPSSPKTTAVPYSPRPTTTPVTGTFPKPATHPLPPKPVVSPAPLLKGVKRERPDTPETNDDNHRRRRRRTFRWPTIDSNYTTNLQGEGDLTIRSISFNSDGSQFVVSCGDHTVRIWNNGSREEIARLSHNSPVLTATWMDNDAGVVVLSEDGLVSQWTRSGLNHWKWAKILDAGRETLTGDDTICLAYTRDRIAVSFPRQGVRVWVWLKGTWQPQRSIIRLNVTTIVFVEAGDAIMGGTRDGVLWYCEIPNGTLRAYGFFKSKINSIDVSPTGSHVLVSQVSGVARLVTIRQTFNKGSIEQSYSSKETEARLNNGFGAIFATKGQAILFCNIDGCILVWDRKKGSIVYGLEHEEDDIIEAAASFDGSTTKDGCIITATSKGRMSWWPQPVAAPTPDDK